MTLSENATSSIWGNRSSATFPLSLARTATPACSTFASISPREAGQDYGTVVVVVVVVDPWILIRGGSNHHTSMPAIFISFLERAYVCVERFARQTLYFFFFFSLRYSRASPPRYITFVWSFFGLSNGFATLRGVHSARKETWCSRKSRKSRKSGSLYFVQRVGSTIL